MLRQWWYQWKGTSRAIDNSTEIDIIVQGRTCRSLHASLSWVPREPRWAILDIAFKSEEPRWKSALFSLQATSDCGSFPMVWNYLHNPREPKLIMHNRGTQGPFCWPRTRANGFSVLSPWKESCLTQGRMTGINTRKKKIVNKKDKQIKEGCYGLLNNLSSG